MGIIKKIVVHDCSRYSYIPWSVIQSEPTMILPSQTHTVDTAYVRKVFQISELFGCRPSVDFMHCTFHNCLFIDCDFYALTFTNCTFEGCSFVNVTADGGFAFMHCVMAHCSFEYEALKDASIKFSGVLGDDIHFFTLDEDRMGYRSAKSLPYINLRFIYCVLGNLDLDCLNPNSVFNDASTFTTEITDNMAGLLNPVCSEGTIIGYKKALVFPDMDNHNHNDWKGMKYAIVKLEIPADARRFSGLGRKCRCDKAKVLDIYNVMNRDEKYVAACSGYDDRFIYALGKEVCEPEFDPAPEMCAPGIHFFISEKEAKDYVL